MRDGFVACLKLGFAGAGFLLVFVTFGYLVSGAIDHSNKRDADCASKGGTIIQTKCVKLVELP